MEKNLKNEVTLKPTSEFPLLARYKERFDINERTIFAYDNVIYANYSLPDHLIIHEQTHFAQQAKYGLDNWVEQYLADDSFRLKMELQAYRRQLQSVKDRNERNKLRIIVAKDLSGSLYGGISTYEDAFMKLK